MTLPHHENQRIDLLDQIRGVALFAIFLVNIPGLTTVADADPFTINSTLEATLAIGLQDSARPLFAFMFGISLVLIYDRLNSKSLNPYPTLIRRFGILFIIGAFHGYFVWAGDILLLYASAGFVLLLSLKLSKKWFISLGIIFWLGYSVGLDLLNFYTSLNLPPDEWLKYFLGSKDYPTGTEYLLIEFSSMIDHLGYFFFGMYAYRSGVFSREWRERQQKWTAGIGVLLLGLLGKTGSYFEVDSFWFHHLDDFYSFLVTIGLTLCLLLLGTSRQKISSLLLPFSAVGKLTFTHYLMQSLILVSLFQGSGRTIFIDMGIWKSPSYVFAMSIGLLVFGFQMFISPLWLKAFYYGPFEWIWRMGTHGKWVPLIRRRPLHHKDTHR
ncbi:DUF418 domain-containing protein [Alteribacillus sp. HJP-4]|uniref:DUF418 domain-containing protein n=1 Tax=Alteribacillus sp. HJP-4 TaxID=2775394 RepID=UPI0035CD3B2B